MASLGAELVARSLFFLHPRALGVKGLEAFVVIAPRDIYVHILRLLQQHSGMSQLCKADTFVLKNVFSVCGSCVQVI